MSKKGSGRRRSRSTRHSPDVQTAHAKKATERKEHSQHTPSLPSARQRTVDGVHGHTTGLGEVVPLALGLEEGPAGLEQRLVDPAATSDDTDGGTGVTADGLLGAGRETDAGLGLALGRVADDGGVVARGARERSTVTGLLLDVAHDRTFGALVDREHVANVEGGLLAAVDERAGAQALGRDERLGLELVAVRVAEGDSRERCATASVVDNVLDDAADVAVALGKVQGTEAGRVLAVVLKGHETASARARRLLPLRRGRTVCALKIPPDFLWLRMTRCGVPGGRSGG